ncbi:hypothetical protein SHKM778_60740 [Streptomyces sp. KM77-8]|uniref:Uncharacterized protein n=1 Tax=Streptomyces haneummycinicus TaxID=3074435 RepID=A0AAT9HQE9_9ACTN
MRAHRGLCNGSGLGGGARSVGPTGSCGYRRNGWKVQLPVSPGRDPRGEIFLFQLQAQWRLRLTGPAAEAGAHGGRGVGKGTGTVKHSLSDKQLELLKQVAAASKAFEVQGAHSGVLWALEQRTLVKTGYGAAGRRTAVVTADGRFYLKHGKHPKEAEAQKQRLEDDPAQAALAPADGPALLARIREAGGALTVTDCGPKTRARWRAAYYHALHHGHVPDGCKLRFNGRDKGDMVLKIVDEAARKAAEPPAVPMVEVPDELPRKPHPLVARTLKKLGRSKTTADTRDLPDVVPMNISRHLTDRALRIAHALITEAEQRGWEVTTDSSLHRGEATHRLVIRIGTHTYPWQITELTSKAPHEPTPQELRNLEKNPWARKPRSTTTISTAASGSPPPPEQLLQPGLQLRGRRTVETGRPARPLPARPGPACRTRRTATHREGRGRGRTQAELVQGAAPGPCSADHAAPWDGSYRSGGMLAPGEGHPGLLLRSPPGGRSSGLDTVG